jgi:hypothetical protein
METVKWRRGKIRWFSLILFFGLLLTPLLCLAVPGGINYQGQLTDLNGKPVEDGTVSIEFALYTSATGGTPLWGESLDVEVSGGIFNVRLGEASQPFPSDIFTYDSLYLAISVAGDPEMTPRQPLTSVPFAMQSGDSQALDGYNASSFALSGHSHALSDLQGLVNDSQIPAAITRDTELEIGLSTKADSSHSHALSDLQGLVNDSQIPAAITRDTELNAGLAAKADSNHDHDNRYYQKIYIDALEARIAALETLLSHFSRNGDDITISGANLHINNGTGSTDSAVNGKGNLIIGYNESRETFGEDDDRTGSHNLVIGAYQNYSSYGGLVAGFWNTISGSWASVSGGYHNEANGDYSSISGGDYNETAGLYSSVSGGYDNEAIKEDSSVSGGAHNTASGNASSVSGGAYNTASGNGSSVSGGGGLGTDDGNTAFGNYSSILGGYNNLAGDIHELNHDIGLGATVSGGKSNTARGDSSSVSGGESNLAKEEYSSVSGGLGNEANGEHSSVSGGRYNEANGKGSSVSGGGGNKASGDVSSVNGGVETMASGDYSSVSGGNGNEASGDFSSVSGGSHRVVTGENDWRAGDLFQDH